MAAGGSELSLSLQVISASGLSQKDIFGYSDPYVVINTENKNVGCPWEPSSRSVRTKTCKKTLNPVWNENFIVNFDPLEEFVVLDVFDENRITRDDFLGRVILTPEYLANVQSRCSINCFLEKRSERSNVSGTILLGINFYISGSDNSNNDPADEDEDILAEDTYLKRMFYQIIDQDNLKKQFAIIASGVRRLKILVQRNEVHVKMNSERRELILPYTRDYQVLRKCILRFFFDSPYIIQGNFREAFKGALEKVFEDGVMVRRLQEKLNVQTRMELGKLDLKLESETGGAHCEIRYISKYRTLILPATAWPADPLSTSLEDQIDQILADLKDWTMGDISEPHPTEDSGASVDEELEHQLSITRGQFGEEGPALPAGWDWRRDQNGRILYVDHNNQRTTFNRPQEAPDLPCAGPDQEVRRAPYRRVVSHEDESQWVPLWPPVEEDGSLPPGWEMKFTKEGRPFYVDHSTCTTSWVSPANSKAIRSQLSSDLGPLPQGWEEKKMSNGKIFYVDHNSQMTTWEDPRFSMTGID